MLSGLILPPKRKLFTISGTQEVSYGPFPHYIRRRLRGGFTTLSGV